MHTESEFGFSTAVVNIASPVQLESLPGLVQGVRSEDRNTQIEAVTQFRKLLSIGKRPGLVIVSIFAFCFSAL